MRIRIIVIFAILLSGPYPALAIDPNALGFLQGAVEELNRQHEEQRQQQQSIEAFANSQAVIVDTVSAQYNRCIAANPFGGKERINVYNSAVAASNQCLNTTVHNITEADADDIPFMLKAREKCVAPLLNYSGRKDAFIVRSIKAEKELENALQRTARDYLGGKITWGKFLKRNQKNFDIRNATNKKIGDDVNYAENAYLEERDGYCRNQQQALNQGIERDADQQAMTQTIRHQQEEINQLKESQQQSDVAYQQRMVGEDEGKRQGLEEGYAAGQGTSIR